MNAFLLIKSHFLQPQVVTARLSYRGQKVLLHYWTAWTDACPLGSSKAIRGAAEWSCCSIYSCCHYSRPSAKTLLDYRNGAEQVKRAPEAHKERMVSHWWAAHVLAISPRRWHCSLLSLQSPVKMAEPAWNPWKAYSLFWRDLPHSSCLCDPITTVHYPPPTRTRLYVLAANVDSALCSTAPRAGSADWCHLKEKKKSTLC